MILEIQCNSIEMNNLFYVMKNIIQLIMIIAPILAIISLSILITKKIMKPDDEKIIKKIKTVFNALVIIFFIPTIMNVTMYILGNKTAFSSCYVTSQKIDSNSTYIPVEENNKTKIIKEETYEEGYVHQLNFTCKSNYVAQFSCDTIHIVEHHYLDFNYYTKESVVAQYGGFDKWVESLGGYFKEFYNEELKTPETAYDFQRISEYVFGLMYIHGFDYYNGSTMEKFDEETKYCKWGGTCIKLKDIAEAKKEAEEKNEEIKIEYPKGTQDAFYPGEMIYGDHGYMNGKNFDKGIAGYNMTTNCNNSVDMVYYKANILGTSERPYSSADYSAQVKDKNNKIVTDFKDVQIGDLIHFFDHSVDPGNPSTWSGWKHIAYVGEINYETGEITAYDGGSYFTSNRNHKWTFNRNNTTSSLHGFKGWAIIHIIDLR